MCATEGWWILFGFRRSYQDVESDPLKKLTLQIDRADLCNPCITLPRNPELEALCQVLTAEVAAPLRRYRLFHAAVGPRCCFL